MPDVGSNFLGAMQNSGDGRNRKNVTQCNNNYQQQLCSSSSYLILSPSNPLRTFAIFFLTHWLYNAVIILTICAFAISSAYCNFRWDGATTGFGVDSTEIVHKECGVLVWSRRILFIVILLEILIKLLARGFLVGELSYLRIKWDWLDVISLAVIFVSMIIPWKALDSLAAGIVLLKLIPLHTGSINAFISLCSCAKNLIPVLIYWIIIVWIYGIVIFTLFVKYQQQDVHEDGDASDNSVSKANGSDSDSVENENITEKNHVAAFVDGDYLTPSASKTSKNFSFGLSVECLPTNLRSLRGSIIQVWMMLTLEFSQSDLISTIPRGNISSQSKLESLCQYEIYILSIVETLVIITGTLPMITMTFGALSNFFQRKSDGTNKLSLQHDDNETEQESQSSYQYRQRRLGSGVSGRSNNTHSQNDFEEGSACSSSSFFKQIANLLCDCDYYFCCLANLQRRLNPCATRLLTSTRFKVYVIFVTSIDFLCMIILLWFNGNRGGGIDFPPTWLITYCVQICFVLYTVEAVFKWFAVSSDEYWLNIWSAFDLTVVCVYWIGYLAMHVWSCQSFNQQFYGILIIRMLKLVPYCKPLHQSLNIMMSSLLDKLHLFVILICSCSTILVKHAICMSGTESQSISNLPSLDENTSYLFYFQMVAKYFSNIILYFLCSCVVICIFLKTIAVLKAPQVIQHVNASVSFLLNDSYSEDPASMQFQLPRSNLNESASPMISIMSFPAGISPTNYRFASSPSESNNVTFTQETQSMLSPSSDVISPLLSIPNSNGFNGHVQPHYDDCVVSEEPNIHSTNENNDQFKHNSYSYRICTSKGLILDLATSLVTILSSINITLDFSHDMHWNPLQPGGSLWLEVLFIFCITVHIIYKTALKKFARDAFLQISCVFDLLIVLATAVEVFNSGMKWLPLSSVEVFVNCAKVLSACRGLILFSRIPWLQSVGSSLCKVFWNVANYLAGFGYIWFIFILCSIETQKIIISATKNGTDSVINAKTMGHNNDLSKNGSTEANIIEELFIPHSTLIVLTIVLLLLSFGVFLGLLFHKVGSWSEIITMHAFANQTTQSSSQALAKLGMIHSTPASSFHKPTEGICVPVLYFVTNHLNFDIMLMTLILFDGLVITLEHLATSDRALILRKHYPAYILFLYVSEMLSKIAGNGIVFFKSKWNIFDAVTIIVCVTDFLISIAWHGGYIPLLILNLRFLRILRIFQFQPFVQRARLIPAFFSSTSKVYAMLRNFTLFYFALFFVTIIFRLRCSQFIPTEQDTLLLKVAPFQVVSAQTLLQVIGNLNLVNVSLEDAFSFFCLTLFSLIRISVIFSIWLVLLGILCLLLAMQEQEESLLRRTDVTEINRFPKRHQAALNESVDSDDKLSYSMPRLSPPSDTIDVETPSTSGANYRASSSSNNVKSNNTLVSANTEEPEPAQSNVQSNSLYKTRTITSSEEINGCKVFYVEAMITTV